MATRRWKGGATPVAQVNTITVGGTAVAGQTYTVTINGRTVTYTALTGDANADIAAGLRTALAASTMPEFLEVTWSVATAVVSGTATTPGKPFVNTSSASGTGSLTTATATASSGPNYWSVAANWKEASVPVSSDDVILDEGPSILYGVDQSAVTLTSLRIGQGFGSNSAIGLPPNSNMNNPEDGYPEYRSQFLAISATTVTIDTPSRRMRLALGTNAATVTVHDTGDPLTSREPALEITGTHASNLLRVNKGNVGVAIQAADTSTFSEIEVSFRSVVNGDATVRLGSGLTLTTLNQSGGTIQLDGGVTTITRTGGTLTRVGTGTITTLNNRGGQFFDDGTGTITTLNQSAEYYRRGLASLTVTNSTLYSGSITMDANGTITWTNAVNLSVCHPAGPPSDPGPRPAYFQFGYHRKITVADI